MSRGLELAEQKGPAAEAQGPELGSPAPMLKANIQSRMWHPAHVSPNA